MIRLVLVGLGHIGRIHSSAITQIDGLQLVAGCDPDSLKASVLPDMVPFFASYAELGTSCDFDVAVVATPNRTHSALAQEVLASGRNVIVEKPAALSLDDFERVERTASDHGRHVYYAFHAACAPEVRDVQLHLAKHRATYGPITGFHSHFLDPYINEHHSLVPDAQALEDPWIDSGVNALSVLDAFVPLETLRQETTRRSGRAEEEPGVLSVSVAYRFPSGEHASGGFGLVETSWDQGRDHKSTTLYFGVSGWQIAADHSQQEIRVTNPMGEVREVAKFGGDRLLNHYLAVFSDYRDRVINGLSMNNAAARRVHSKLFEGMQDL